MKAKFSDGGFRIPPMGGNRNLIKSAVANEVVRALNALGNIQIARNEQGFDEVIYSDGNVVLSLAAKPSAFSTTQPFQIYQSVSWLKFKVTTGMVLTGTTGTIVTPNYVETEFTLTGGVAEYWFYISLSASPAIVKSATQPTWDETMIPIGFVDTSNTTTEVSTITQFYPFGAYVPCV